MQAIKTTVTVTMYDNQQVPTWGLLYPCGLAVTRLPKEKTFNITHVVTGLTLSSGWAKLDRARACLKALATVTDWSAVSNRDAITDDIRAKARMIIAEFKEGN